MKTGSIVLIPFPFTDLRGSKTRPALVLYEANQDILVAFITSQTHHPEEFDLELEASAESGLKRKSLLRLTKMVTLDKDIALGRLGLLSPILLAKVRQQLYLIFDLLKT